MNAGENDPNTFKIIGAAMDVHAELGPNHPEVVYRTALVEELKSREIEINESREITFTYKGHELRCTDIPFHLICFSEILVEIKTVPKLLAEDQNDLREDLADADCDRGLLLNFARPRLEVRRVVPSTETKEPAAAPSAKPKPITRKKQ